MVVDDVVQNPQKSNEYEYEKKNATIRDIWAWQNITIHDIPFLKNSWYVTFYVTFRDIFYF